MNSSVDFEKNTDLRLEEIENAFQKKVTIAIIGKVSAGKSSLLNAFFNRTRENQLASVGAISGVTTKVKRFKVSQNVEVLDSPGLDDIIDANSAETRNILEEIDIGILVLSDSADISQKRHYEDLKKNCRKVFVVLNKIDMYDKKKSALQQVLSQWKEVLSLPSDETIFPTCADGYDPNYDSSFELDIRGVEELRSEVYNCLAKYGKALILEREMNKKSALARKVIYTALISVGVEAFIPGSAIYIAGTQAATIMAIHYIYTGEKLSKKSALAVLPIFASQSIGSNIFLWAKSVLPPTGVLDMAAASVAVLVTLAMLSTVNWIYENGYNLDDKSEIKSQFNKIYNLLEDIGAKEIAKIVINKDVDAVKKLIEKFVK
jgi:uncharacterized protein